MKSGQLNGKLFVNEQLDLRLLFFNHLSAYLVNIREAFFFIKSAKNRYLPSGLTVVTVSLILEFMLLPKLIGFDLT
ncbi:hypothetical protein CWC21_08805 [Pseudoalteromonas phenolica]|nr:hypothetical protein CWC21_08805 [Pseudoalteromonas phenolica]